MSIIRVSIDSATNLIGWLRRSRRINPTHDPVDGLVKINLGCGLAVAKGWLNIDASLNALIASWPQVVHKLLYRLSGANRYYSMEEYCDIIQNNIFIHHDLSHSLPLRDSTVDFFYSSHFLEHLYKNDAKHLLSECFRALKEGGIVRVAIPDLEYAVSLYLKGDKEQMLQNYFFVEDKGSVLARHKYMYDFDLLSHILECVGFKQITLCSFQKGLTPDLHSLDNRAEDTLFVEATKIS